MHIVHMHNVGRVFFQQSLNIPENASIIQTFVSTQTRMIGRIESHNFHSIDDFAPCICTILDGRNGGYLVTASGELFRESIRDNSAPAHMIRRKVILQDHYFHIETLEGFSAVLLGELYVGIKKYLHEVFEFDLRFPSEIALCFR